MKRKIELLAPAKDFQTAVDAIDCGADAVYIGGAKFGARYAAGNSLDDIRRTVEYAHRYRAKVYATLNTLLFDDELAEAERLAREIIATGVDALIIQDVAYCRMGLDAELHSSTQMNNTTPEQARFLAESGFARVILERALSLEEIRAIRSATDVELEYFVHGAICVGHSGRCFLSRSMGNRSGNRGACTQPCRLTYDLTDANRNVIIKGKHLLSVRDLDLSKRLGDLLDAGISSFKIEGRLKERTYVRNIVSHYRRALDEALAERPELERASVGISHTEFTPDPAKSFTRGGSEYMLDGKASGVASFDTPKSVGEYLGRVSKIVGKGFRIDGTTLPDSGDGICIITPQGVCGTNINGCDGGIIRPNSMDGITLGAEVYRNFDSRFNRLLERGRIKRTIAATASVEVLENQIGLTFTDEEGFSASVTRQVDFEPAGNIERTNEVIRTQCAKSGETIFTVGKVDVSNPEGLFVPASLVADLRREALALLLEKRISRPSEHHIFDENPSPRYPKSALSAQDNVTNRLAEAFYRDHGVDEIAAPLELSEDFGGECVMVSSYCIRREIGQCLREKPTLKGDLYIEHGTHRYRLDFDCKRCEMRLLPEK